MNGMKKKEIPYLRRKLGIVFQDFQLLTDRSVYKNLWFAMRATGWRDKTAMRQNAFDVLDKVNIKHKDYKIPGELSGGEQQRVAIARAPAPSCTIPSCLMCIQFSNIVKVGGYA